MSYDTTSNRAGANHLVTVWGSLLLYVAYLLSYCIILQAPYQVTIVNASTILLYSLLLGVG
jgi:hypothetical protein